MKYKCSKWTPETIEYGNTHHLPVEGKHRMTNCPKCGLSKTDGSSGSITQWISVCVCEQRDSRQQLESGGGGGVQLCGTCGKRTKAGRDGSLTQWVFRQDLCKCKQHQGGPQTESAEQFARKVRATRPSLDMVAPKEEIELELDPSSFPTERYKPLLKLGSGAAGDVYLCKDRLLQKKVAVKTLHKITASELVGFQMEAKATSTMTHPCIVRVYDFGATAFGAPFMVLEYVEGTSLEKLLQECDFIPWRIALEIMEHLCEALSYAHASGVLHRDLKPSNILVSKDDSEDVRVCLIDFGVAKVKSQAQQEPTIIQGVTLVGTPIYMSADQINGIEYDERSEIYSLGCIIYECMNGRPPFKGETALETLSLHAKEQPPAFIQQDKEAIPDSVQSLILTCLKKNPAERFQSAEEVRKAIQQIRKDPGGLSTTIGTTFKKVASETQTFARSFDNKNAKSKSIIVLSCCLVLIAAIGVFAYLTLMPPQEVPIVKTRSIVDPTLSGTKLFDANTYNDLTTEKRAKTEQEVKKLLGTTDTHVDLMNNKLTADALQKLPISKIESFRVVDQSLDDTAFDTIGNMHKLRIISLCNTNTSAAEIRKFKNLRKLEVIAVDACHNFDDEALLLTIAQFPGLTSLNISETRVTSKSLQQLPRLKQLKCLEVAFLDINEGDLKCLCAMPLVELSLHGSKVPKNGVKLLSSAKTLRKLSLQGIAGMTPQIMVSLQESLPKCSIEAMLPQEIEGSDIGGLFMESVDTNEPKKDQSSKEESNGK